MYDTLKDARGMAKAYANHYKAPMHILQMWGGFYVVEAKLEAAELIVERVEPDDAHDPAR